MDAQRQYKEDDFGMQSGEKSIGTVVPTPVPTPVLVENWPKTNHKLGQVTAVSIDTQGKPVIFHRADRYWNAK